MTYGRVRRVLPALVPCFVLLCLAAFPLSPVCARPAPASEKSGTLLTISDHAVDVQGADGRAFTVTLTPATWVLRRGQVVSVREFVPGEAVRLRLGRLKGGVQTAALLCDPETAAGLTAAHGRPLVGTLLSTGGAVWTVQPEAASLPLPVCLTSRTVFHAGGIAVAESAFSAGASVAITTRGLANGLLAAVSVAEAPVSGHNGVPSLPVPASVSGRVLEVRADLGLLTLTDSTGAAQTVAVDAGTRITVGRRAAGLEAVAPGLRVRVRLGAGRDAAGHPVAARVSVSAAQGK